MLFTKLDNVKIQTFSHVLPSGELRLKQDKLEKLKTGQLVRLTHVIVTALVPSFS